MEINKMEIEIIKKYNINDKKIKDLKFYWNKNKKRYEFFDSFLMDYFEEKECDEIYVNGDIEELGEIIDENFGM